MEAAFRIAALWLALAVMATVLASRLRISMALVEICVGAAAGAAAARWDGAAALGADEAWLRFVAATGAVLLTFLAGAELDPGAMRAQWREVVVIGLVSFAAPFLGCAAAAHWLLHWGAAQSWLAGVALSTTSMAVVYAVMIEHGFNRTAYGKGILGACFVTDLGTVIALGLIFAPFTARTAIFIVTCVAALLALPPVTARLTAAYGHKTAAIRTKWILGVLFGLGALAIWAGSEAVLPAYLAGMALAGTLSRDHFYIRRLRTLTIGFLTPFYFLRAGTLVSLPALWAAPLAFVLLLGSKVATKIFGLYPVIGRFRPERRERWYYTLLMSTGLTFGTISALYGLSHGIISRPQYSLLVLVVIGSAVVPTLIANLAFLPRHLMPRPAPGGNGNGADSLKDE